MASLLISRRVWRRRTPTTPIGAAEQRARNRTHPKMVLACGSLRMTVPYAPTSPSTGGYGATWTEIPRPGRVPLLLRTGPKLQTMAWDLMLGTQDIDRDIRPELAVLKQMADSAEPVTITNGPGGTRRWHITDMTVVATQHQQQTNQPSRATVTVTLTQSSELAPAPGPVKGGVKAPTPAKPAPKAPSKKAPVKPSARVHVVKKGQTLSSISYIYYKTPSRWKVIASANHLRNPNLIYPGQKLRIP